MQTSLYKPKENHPWRRYKNKAQDENVPHEVKPSLKLFLSNLAVNWDTYQVEVDESILGDYQNVKGLSDDKVAEWLVGFIRKNWLSHHREAIVIE